MTFITMFAIGLQWEHAIQKTICTGTIKTRIGPTRDMHGPLLFDKVMATGTGTVARNRKESFKDKESHLEGYLIIGNFGTFRRRRRRWCCVRCCSCCCFRRCCDNMLLFLLFLLLLLLLFLLIQMLSH